MRSLFDGDSPRNESVPIFPSSQKLSISVSHTNIVTDGQLQQYCQDLVSCPWIAFDTEFVSERTFRPVLCLIQVATEKGLTLIDARAVEDIRPFWRAISQPGHETIVHAGRGEFEFCLRAVDLPPSQLFDVQIAAGLVGIEYPASFRSLLYKVLGLTSKKEETRTDWRRRPLTDRQIEYALDDVRYLRQVRDKLQARLQQLGRAEWLEDEMDVWQGDVQQALSQDRWRRVSGNSGLDRQALAIVRELWRWREDEAKRRDCPVRRVLRDDLIVELAKRKTADVNRIKAVRGLERGDLKRRLHDIAQRIDRALQMPEEQWPQKAIHGRGPQLSVLGQFLSSALGNICRQAELAPAMVGTPSDVRDLIAYRTGQSTHNQPPRLARGWRAELVGRAFDGLLAGEMVVRISDPTSDHPLVFESTEPPDQEAR